MYVYIHIYMYIKEENSLPDVMMVLQFLSKNGVGLYRNDVFLCKKMIQSFIELEKFLMNY